MSARRTHRQLPVVAILLILGLVSITAPIAAMSAVDGPSGSSVSTASGPSVSAPSVHLKALGRLGTSTIPLRVSWPRANPSGSPIDHYELQVSRDGGAWSVVALPSSLTRSVVVQTSAWGVIAFRVRAVDRSAASGDWAESSPLWPTTAQEDDPAVGLSLDWTIISKTTAFEGRRATTTTGGATATFTFTGREVGWVARLGPKAGTANVSVDGGPATVVDLHRSSASNRRLVYAASWSTTAQHVVTLTTTRSGYGVDVDAFIVLGDPSAATLVGAGDIASCSSAADNATAIAAASVNGTVFTAGDNVYPDGSPDNYTNCYDPSWGTLKTRTQPVPGNHDYYNNPGAAGYFAYFGAAAGDPAKGWYRYEAGTWRIYALNSECDATTCLEQYDWLNGDLAAEPHLCTLAIWHRPRFSTGPHGDATDMAAIFKLLYENHAEVVLNGHDHVYERFMPINADGAPDAANGVREFVVGTGGAPLYTFTTDSTSIDVRDDSTYGVLRLDLAEGAYSWQFIPAGGGTFTDSGTGTCH
jgi:Calcineurin-like phosphoesterase